MPRGPRNRDARGAHDGAHDGARQEKRRSLACERERRVRDPPLCTTPGATVPLSRAVCPVMIGGVPIKSFIRRGGARVAFGDCTVTETSNGQEQVSGFSISVS